MSKKNKPKNVTSIAIKINAISVRDLFFRFLAIDICLIIILIILWCIQAEKDFYGELVKNAQRSFNFFPIENSTYTVVWSNGKTMVKEAGAFLYYVRKIVIILGIVELKV